MPPGTLDRTFVNFAAVHSTSMTPHSNWLHTQPQSVHVAARTHCKEKSHHILWLTAGACLIANNTDWVPIVFSFKSSVRRSYLHTASLGSNGPFCPADNASFQGLSLSLKTALVQQIKSVQEQKQDRPYRSTTPSIVSNSAVTSAISFLIC